MPPKKTGKSEPSKKTVEKKKEKIIEDKTFGLKNKKGKKQQQFIKNVQTQVKFGQQSSQKLEALQFEAKKKKVADMEAKKEMDSLFKPVARPQKLSADADPKSVLCLFFRQGMCTKGDKCKFSHDLSLEGKAEKRSMYVDARDLENDTIDTWDEDKLKEVVQKKHGAKVMPKTDIVCKFFLQAIEDGKYGWFWECPSGGDKCIYRHCLPPGFVFKTKKKPDESVDVDDKITMEQLVEEERQKLITSGKALTKVTLESFLAWKKRKLKEKKDKLELESSKKKEALKAGRTVGISGREMFEFNPDLQGEGETGDDDEETVVIMKREEEEDIPGATAVDLTNFNEWIPLSTPDGAVGYSSDAEGAVGGMALEIDEQLFTEEDIPVDEGLFDIDEDEQIVLEEQLLLSKAMDDLHIDNVESDSESVE